MILMIAAFLGGVLTIVSPCIVPVLPFVFSRAGRFFVKGGLPMLAAVGRGRAVHANGAGAAIHGASAQAAPLRLVYSTGAASSRAAAVIIGGQMFAGVKKSFRFGERARQGLGVAVLAGVAVIAFGVDTDALAQTPYANTSKVEQALLDGVNAGRTRSTATAAGGNSMQLAANDVRQIYRSNLPVEGQFPSLAPAVEWLNSPPLSPGQLRGKVVLVNFWTYSCINCIRAIPYVRSWAQKYKDQGLVVIGVHTPEFPFEKNINNIKQAISRFQIGYPVAVDSNFGIWRAFQNSYWPAFYFIDANGQIRYHQFGEGSYDRSEQVIQELLAEAGSQVPATGPVAPNARGAEAPPDLGDMRSGETYVGYREASNFASPEGLQRDRAQNYTTTEPALNKWGLSGNWTVGPEEATLNQPGGAITYKFSARDLHLVLGPSANGKPVRFRVTIDGQAPGDSHGADTDAGGNGTITETRLYQLVRQAAPVKTRVFEIRFLDPGAEAFVFTFG
jgi:thiol-disulfide isomerase/thioredoxin